MKRRHILLTQIMMMAAAGVYAQPNIFNPNDPIVLYKSSNPPATPAANKMAKWVKTTSRITNWNTSKFKAYYWNGMAFRLRFPNGYNAADTTKKYPVIIFMHGAGEIKGIYENEDQLYWGAEVFQSKIDSGKFNGFLLFPQVSLDGWDFTYYTRINSVLDSMQKYVRADPDKVIAMGLSNGAFGAMSYAANFPQRVSTIIASSPALIQLIQGTIDNVIHIPFWIASGGLDNSPGPDVVNTYVDTLNARGGDTRYDFYPDLAHGTWEKMWSEQWMLPYWNNAHTANPIIFNKESQFCVNAVRAKIGITQGFAEYQWRVNGVDIPNSNSNDIIGNQIGSYRARFRRIAGGAWSDWSLVPAVITALPATSSPAITVTGVRSVVLPAPDGSITTPLELPTGYSYYEWRRATDSVLVSTARTYNAPQGQYIAKAANCNASFSPVFRIISSAGTPKPDSARNLTLTRISPTRIKLTWKDVTNPVYNETGFEIYRSVNEGAADSLIAITTADINSFTDSAVSNNYNFYYRIRAVNTTGASGLSNQISLQPAVDSIAPSIPLQVKALFTSRSFIDLEWNASTDSVGVTSYDIYVNGINAYSTTLPKIRADKLAANTSYSFTIVARDQAGNASGSSNPVTAMSKLNGVKYHYYTGNWSVLPDFSALTHVASGTSANIDISARPAGVSQNYGFVWEGLINIKTPGTYTFETVSDDGSKFYFNSFYAPAAVAIANNDGIHGAIPASGTVNIPDTGLYPIAVTFFQQSSGQSMQVYWTGPGISRQLIPNSAFTETFTAPSDTTAPTAPANVRSTFTSRNYVDLAWNPSSDSVGVVSYDVYINNAKKYTTTTTSVSVDSLLPNVAYTFAIKARDFAGNQSAAGTVTVVTAATALKYKYYEGNWTMLPDFSSLTPVKTGATPNVNIAVRPTGTVQNYAFVWEGYINIKTAGSYTFETTSDDGSKFYFDSFYSNGVTALVSNDGIHGAVIKTGTVNVTDTGMHPVAITYFQQSSGQSMQVYWTGPGIPRQLIPDSAFTQSFRLAGDVTAPTAPAGVRTTFLGNTTIDLAWTASADNIGVVAYDLYVGGVKKYSSPVNSITADSLAPNTTYVFTVRARDLAGNSSAASTSLSAKTATTAAGLKYACFQGAWDVLPNFTTLSPVKSGTSANADLTVRPAGVDDNFGFLWQGYINIPAAGTYTFETISDDGSKLYFNSAYLPGTTATVNNDGLHGATAATGTVLVATPGYYPITIAYFERSGGQSMEVYWSSNSITRSLIPASAFVYQLPADNIAPGAPANVTAVSKNSSFINLTWAASTDNVGVTGYDVYINGTKKEATSTNSITVDSLTAGTSYTFTIKALDFAGNASPFSAPLTTTTSATSTGLTYKYYEGTWDLLPDFSSLTPVKTGFTPNVDIATARNQADNYGFVWEGNISLPTAGTYTFETISDDGSKIYFNKTYSANATALVNNDGVHGAISATGAVTVAAGVYPIAISFFEKNSGERMQVYWTGPGIPRQLIPNAAFTAAFALATDTIAPSAPANVTAILTTNTYVDISWDKSTDNIGVIAYDVYVNAVKKSTVTGTSYRLSGLTGGQSNTFTVKAVDLANNFSSFSSVLTVVSAPKALGLKYRYYEGAWSNLPNFDSLTAIKTGSVSTTDISVKPASVNDNFAFVWEGYINITTPGLYTFETISDDGSKFYWNSLYNPAAMALVNNDGLHGANSVSGSVNVTIPGLYPISITYFERDGGETMQVYYSGPGIARQLLAGTALNFAGTATATMTASSTNEVSADVEIRSNLSKAFPNPFTDNIKIQHSFAGAARNVTIGIYDMNGRMIQTQLFTNLPEGTATFTINLEKQVIPGLYLLKLDVDGKQIKIWKMIKERR